MFGMSFGNESLVHKETLESQELVDSLTGTGIIDGPNSLLPEDIIAIKTRIGLIKNKLAMGDDAAAVLAYIDRMLAVEREHGNQSAVADLMSKVTTDIVAAAVNSHLANNEEFLGTVLTLADQKYLTGSYLTFSEALIDAIKERQEAINAPIVSGKIDPQGNVLTEEDLKPLN